MDMEQSTDLPDRQAFKDEVNRLKDLALVPACVLCPRGTRVEDRPVTACPSVALAEAQVDLKANN